MNSKSSSIKLQKLNLKYYDVTPTNIIEQLQSPKNNQDEDIDMIEGSSVGTFEIPNDMKQFSNQMIIQYYERNLSIYMSEFHRVSQEKGKLMNEVKQLKLEINELIEKNNQQNELYTEKEVHATLLHDRDYDNDLVNRIENSISIQLEKYNHLLSSKEDEFATIKSKYENALDVINKKDQIINEKDKLIIENNEVINNKSSDISNKEEIINQNNQVIHELNNRLILLDLESFDPNCIQTNCVNNGSSSVVSVESIEAVATSCNDATVQCSSIHNNSIIIDKKLFLYFVCLQFFVIATVLVFK